MAKSIHGYDFIAISIENYQSNSALSFFWLLNCIRNRWPTSIWADVCVCVWVNLTLCCVWLKTCLWHSTGKRKKKSAAMPDGFCPSKSICVNEHRPAIHTTCQTAVMALCNGNAVDQHHHPLSKLVQKGCFGKQHLKYYTAERCTNSSYQLINEWLLVHDFAAFYLLWFPWGIVIITVVRLWLKFSGRKQV